MTTDTAAPMTLADILALLKQMGDALDAEGAEPMPRELLVALLRQSYAVTTLLLQAAHVLDQHIRKQDVALAVAKLDVPAGNRKARRKAEAVSRH